MRRAAAALLAVALPLAASPPTITPAIEPGAAAEGAPWTVLVVRGRTDLPDRAILSVFLYDASTDRPLLLDQGRCEAKAGAFEVALARTKGPPLSGTYRAEVVFDPSRQRDDVIEAMTPAPAEVRAEARLVVGTPADRDRDIARERDRLRADLEALSALAEELSKRLSEARARGFDRAAHAEWREGFVRRLAVREEENRDRPYVKALIVSGVGQARHQGLVQLLREASASPLSEAAPETLLPAAQGGLDRFHRALAKALEEAGIVDAASAPAFDAAPFRALAAEAAARWAEGRPDAAWLDGWRARWAQALAAALPALAPRGDQAAQALAAAGARIAACQDAGEVSREIDRLESEAPSFR